MSAITVETGELPVCVNCQLKHAVGLLHHVDPSMEKAKYDKTIELIKEISEGLMMTSQEVEDFIAAYELEHKIEDALTVLRDLRHKIMDGSEKRFEALEEVHGEMNDHGNPIPEVCEFTKESVKPKEYFDRDSFRTICPECPEGRCSLCPPELQCATRIITGCQEGEFIKGRCQVGVETHTIYHGTPKPSLSNPHTVNPDLSQIAPSLERIRHLHTQAIPDEPWKTVDPRTGQQLERFWLPESLKSELIAEFKRPEGEKTGIAAVKYFNPGGAGTWWISEYDPEWDTFFGIASILVAEYGYISRRELRETRLPWSLWIERDYYWRPKTLEEIMREERSKGSHNPDWEHIDFVSNLAILNEDGLYSIRRYDFKLQAWVAVPDVPKVSRLSEAWDLYYRVKSLPASQLASE